MNEYGLLALSSFRSAIINARGRHSPYFDTPRRILVVKLDHLGDLLLATPALRALRDAMPGVPIDGLVHPGSKVLLDGGGLVDQIFEYDSPRFRREAPSPGDDPRAGLLHGLGRQRYDWVVELRGDEWTIGPLLQALRPVRRFDRGTVRLRDWFSRRLSRLTGSRPGTPLHEVETNLQVVHAAIAGGSSIPPVQAPSWPGASAELERALAQHVPTLDPERPYVVIQLGASWSPRAWRPERFGAVASALRRAYDASIIVLGGVRDAPLREAYLAGGGPPESAFFFGSLSIPAVGELLRRARLFIGSDGGVAHLAAACGTASVVLFGPQNPARFRPWGKRIVVLHQPVACYPCSQVVCVRPENPCVNLNTVEEVLTASRQLWNSEPA